MVSVPSPSGTGWRPPPRARVGPAPTTWLCQAAQRLWASAAGIISPAATCVKRRYPETCHASERKASHTARQQKALVGQQWLRSQSDWPPNGNGVPHEIANPASDGDPEAFCEEPAASVTGAFIAGSAAREQGHADGSNSSAHNSTDLLVISSIAQLWTMESSATIRCSRNGGCPRSRLIRRSVRVIESWRVSLPRRISPPVNSSLSSVSSGRCWSGGT